MTGLHELDDPTTTRRCLFGELLIDFDDRVLEPRAWTAAQSELAAELMATAPPGPVLELCAGAGHIGLLAIAREPRPLVSVDLNPVACAWTRVNAGRAGLADLVEVREGAMDEVVDAGERFAVVIADPPWVPRAETGRYPEDPVIAIDGGDDGLDLARSCWRLADRHLLDGGAAVLQLGTTDQLHRLDAELSGPGRLRVREHRTFERGVLAVLERSPDRRSG